MAVFVLIGCSLLFFSTAIPGLIIPTISSNDKGGSSGNGNGNSLGGIVKNLTAETKGIKKEMEVMAAELESLKEHDAILTAALKSLNDKNGKTVMFTVHMKADSFFITRNGVPIKFDQVVTNTGGGYSPQTGVFHAPVAGNYLFILQIMASPGTELEAVINYKGATQTMLHVYQEKEFDLATVTSVIHMNRGDDVTVVRQHCYGSTGLRGGLWSQFSGTLLKAD